ncbi:hypothetical protein ENSA5_63000 [Enhygromyxa salina]|uniref:Uncharacterized protein n=1 Tax=Enhygromyxa salina TaxID=215803 RepID=A0A2S9XCP8_9BACT|nr:hypothetical protein [Enhygromyxa salina]PRP90629.1 hypothetical protein ENSA5_63000 [Enhygromyxa salina]
MPTHARTTILASTCFAALALMPARLLAAPPSPTAAPAPTVESGAPPPPTVESGAPPLPKRAKRQLAGGGVMLGLGFALELSGAIISTRCTLGSWDVAPTGVRGCAAGFSVSVGEPNGPNRYTLVSTGTSSAYVMGRLAAAPLLIGGFTLTMVGVASAGTRASTWSHATKRRLAWSLFGAGLGVLVVSRVMRAVFVATGTCQEPTCVHGFDQSSLWMGRGLTFAGGGMLVQGAARRAELGLGGGPTQGFGVSVVGRF